MNVAVLSRLLWKEQRAQRSFWLAMAALTSVSVLLIGALDKSEHPYAWWLSAFIFMAPGFYAVGCAAVMFAGEKESGTFPFQAALPVSSLTVFTAKCVSAVLGTAALYAVLAAAIAVSSGSIFPPASDRASLVLASILFCLEMLGWGIFYSLLSAHTLRSVVMATATASLCLNGSFILSAKVAWDMDALASGLSWRLVIVAVVLAVDTYLGARWMVERSTARSASQGLASLGSWRSLFSGRQSSIAWRLVWQQWGDMRGVYSVLALAYFFGLIIVGYVQDWNVWSPQLVAGSIALIAALVGSTVFLTDQRRHQRRFLVERGVGPWELWFHRQIVGAFLTVVLSGIVASIAVLARSSQGDFSFAVLLVGIVVVGYAIGQFCSMVISSPVLSCLATLALLVPVSAWMALITLLRLPILLGIVPIPIAFLIASRIHCNDWMREEVSWRSRSKLIAFGSVWSIAVIGSVLVYRVVEIPAVEYPPALRELPRGLTKQQQKQYDVIVQAASSVMPVPDKVLLDPSAPDDLFYEAADRPLLPKEREWLEANAHVLKQLTVLNGQVDPRVQVALHQTARLRWLQTLVLLSARELESQGQLEPALNRYLLGMRLPSPWPLGLLDRRTPVLQRLRTWAAAPQQTPDLLRLAAQQVASANEELFLLAEETLRISDDRWRTFFSTGDFDPPFQWQPKTAPLMRWIPGERWRARRFIRLVVAFEHAALEQLRAGRSLRDAQAVARNQVPGFREEDMAFKGACTAVLAEASFDVPRVSGEYADVLWEERLTRLTMMLYAFQLEKGHFPQSLDELVPDYLPSVPANPRDGTPIHYCRDGIDGLPEDIRTNPNAALIKNAPRNVPTLYGVPPNKRHIVFVPLKRRHAE